MAAEALEFNEENLELNLEARKKLNIAEMVIDNFVAVNFSSEIAEDVKLVLKVKIDEPLEVALNATPEVTNV